MSINKDSQKAPNLRFKGFTDDWEQRTFGNFIDEYVEKTVSQNQYPVLTSSQKLGIVLQEDYFSNRQVTTSKNIGYFVLPKGYFTYRSRSDNGVFVFNRNDSIDKGIISYFYPVFRVMNADSDFFLRRINFGVGHQIAIAAVGTGQHVLSLKKFMNIRAMFPVIQEQVKIGNLFSQLDISITLHQRKLDQLNQLKEALLQQMFPGKGETVPKLRFAGFEGDWEERKLINVVDRVTRRNTNLQSKIPLTISAQFGLVDQITYFSKQVASKNMENYFLLYNGDFAYNKSYSKGYPFGAIKRLDSYDSGALSPLYIVFRPTIVDSNFLVHYFETTKWYTEIIKISAEGARNHGLLNITPSDFFDIELFIPSKSVEQEKIGTLINYVENVVALHQRKLDQLKNTKQVLLQNMFI